MKGRSFLRWIKLVLLCHLFFVAERQILRGGPETRFLRFEIGFVSFPRVPSFWLVSSYFLCTEMLRSAQHDSLRWRNFRLTAFRTRGARAQFEARKKMVAEIK